MRKILIFAVALAQIACTPTIEYGRRSVNEPAFPVVYPNPSIVISSSVQAPGAGGSAAPAAPENPIKVRMNYDGATSKELVELRKAFNADIDEPKFSGNRTVIKRTVAAAITRGDFRPADRFVNFRLRITPNNFEFVDYKSTATDYSVINIEELSLAKTNSASLQLVGGKPIVATGTAGTSRALTESGQVSVRVENLTTNIDYNTLDVYREAERGIDLAGNTLVNVSVTAQKKDYANQTKFALVVTDATLSNADAPVLPKKATLTTADLQYLVPKDLWGSASFEYVMRRVSLRSNEYSEHNQTAFYEKGKCENDKITLVRARDIDVPRWSIAEVDAKGVKNAVRIADQFGVREMVFLDYPSALRLMHWMKKQGATMAGTRNFTFSDEGTALIKAGKYPELKVEMSSETSTTNPDGNWKCESSIIN